MSFHVGFIKCSECGELIDRSADNHECQGSAETRLYALESRVDDLEVETAALRDRVAVLEAIKDDGK